MLAPAWHTRREASMSDVASPHEDTHTLHDLADMFITSPDGPNRTLVQGSPGFKVLHLSLRPGQRMPVHDHAGCYVTIQALTGTATVRLDGARIVVPAGQVLSFPGESRVSPGNDSAEDCAVLITLVDRPG